jgi:hypothetical protein
MNAHPYRTQPALSPADHRVLLYALVAALTAALVFAAIALSLALARIPSAPPPPLPNLLPVRAMEPPTCPRVAAAPLPPAAPRLARVRLNTEPDGASVREDGVELCGSTPCDILYKGTDAEPTREHILTITRSGFRAQTMTITPPDSPIRVRLTPRAAL